MFFFRRRAAAISSPEEKAASGLESDCLRRKRLFHLEMLEPRVLLSAAPIDAPGDLIAADPELSTIEVVEESVLHENAQTPAEEALAPVKVSA